MRAHVIAAACCLFATPLTGDELVRGCCSCDGVYSRTPSAQCAKAECFDADPTENAEAKGSELTVYYGVSQICAADPAKALTSLVSGLDGEVAKGRRGRWRIGRTFNYRGPDNQFAHSDLPLVLVDKTVQLGPAGKPGSMLLEADRTYKLMVERVKGNGWHLLVFTEDHRYLGPRDEALNGNGLPLAEASIAPTRKLVVSIVPGPPAALVLAWGNKSLTATFVAVP